MDYDDYDEDDLELIEGQNRLTRLKKKAKRY